MKALNSVFWDRIAVGGASLVVAFVAAACLATSNGGDKAGLDTAEPTTTPSPSTTETPTPSTTEVPTPSTTEVPTPSTTEVPMITVLSNACGEPLGEGIAPTFPLGEADIDGDNEGLFADDTDEWVWVRTAPDRFSAPAAVNAPRDLLDAADLDGDGDEELFVGVLAWIHRRGEVFGCGASTRKAS